MRLPLLTLFLFLFAATCLGDGMVFPAFRVPGTEAPPHFPSQRAVLKWDGQEETMLVETTLAGPRGQYGWVVPLPHRPSFVKAVRPEYVEGTFAQVKPAIHRLPDVQLLPIACIVMLGSAMFLTAGYRYRRLGVGIRFACFVGEIYAMAIGGILLIFLLRGGPASSADSFGSIALQQTKSAAPRLQVESLGAIGSYDVSVLSGPDGEEAFEWMRSHHIEIPDTGKSVMGRYAKEGWVFLAAELRKDRAEALPPHPLKAVFPTDSLIYPMRLTGTQDQPIFLEMVVVADKRAEVEGMDVWTCRNDPVLVSLSRVVASEAGIYSEWHDPEYAMAKDRAVVTYLRGDIRPAQMQRDFEVRFSPYERFEAQVFDRDQARGHELLMFLEGFGGFAFAFGTISLFVPAAAGKLAIAGAITSVVASAIIPAVWSTGIYTVQTVAPDFVPPIYRQMYRGG